MNLVRSLMLRPTLNLLGWILKRTGGNSLIIGGPLGWSWQATLDAAHHGALEGPTSAHRHSDLASIGADDHHTRMHDHSVAGDGSPIAVAGLPNLTQDKIWKGNASNRPAEADPPAGLTFTELDGSASITGSGTWTDWDLSSIVPAGTKFVLVYHRHSTSTHTYGARKNGTAYDRTAFCKGPGWIATECDSNRVIEVYASETYELWGYWA